MTPKSETPSQLFRNLSDEISGGKTLTVGSPGEFWLPATSNVFSSQWIVTQCTRCDCRFPDHLSAMNQIGRRQIIPTMSMVTIWLQVGASGVSLTLRKTRSDRHTNSLLLLRFRHVQRTQRLGRGRITPDTFATTQLKLHGVAECCNG
jgi:hypothetical protein